VPRAVVARSIVWQVLAPVVPALLLSPAVGTALVHAVATGRRAGRSGSTCNAAGSCLVAEVSSIPIPYDRLTLLGAGALAAVLAVVAVGLLFLRSSTDLEELRTT
jgi:hypothetical protein